jgi:hypothetical protein
MTRDGVSGQFTLSAKVTRIVRDSYHCGRTWYMTFSEARSDGRTNLADGSGHIADIWQQHCRYPALRCILLQGYCSMSLVTSTWT